MIRINVSVWVTAVLFVFLLYVVMVKIVKKIVFLMMI